MYLKNLSLINFKNYEQLEIEFSQKINCFVGDNGVGKTNLLDAVYYLSFCKSRFNLIDSQNIKHDENFFVIQGNYYIRNENESVYCGIKRNKKKQFKRNKKEYKKLSDHIGLIPLVLISPYDSNLIIAGSDERRKFLNGVISQFDKQYLEDLIKYNRALSQRNSLLKNFAKTNTFNIETIEIWDEQLIKLGTSIYEKRVNFVNELMPVFQKYYEIISNGNEEVKLNFSSQLHDFDFPELLKNAIERDRILQYTTVGIHKDDLIFKLDDFLIKKNGSQGQQKTFLVALKLAQFDYMKNIYGFKPILLLDDVFDKFDLFRVKQIIKLVAENNFRQIFITDTNKDRVKNILNDSSIEYNLFNVSNDTIELSNNIKL
ncbi:MAG: DNA replication/repair protein RecF [Bacteroidales bacterium]|nr:DNA replication/repair protein RecF [Bacteroidales bacterium]